MTAGSETAAITPVLGKDDDFRVLFESHYPRIAKIIARIVQDPGRAEELAVDVFWRLWRHPAAQAGNSRAWLYRSAMHAGFDELRRQNRWRRFELLFRPLRFNPTPEQLHAASQDQQQVRSTLALLKSRDAELLILQSEGLSYQEMAEILGLNANSIGTLLRRAQQAFRKEYVRRYEQR